MSLPFKIFVELTTAACKTGDIAIEIVPSSETEMKFRSRFIFLAILMEFEYELFPFHKYKKIFFNTA
jgi:hypothetical protein